MQSQLEKLVTLLGAIGQASTRRMPVRRPEAVVVREISRLLEAQAGAMACHLSGQRGILVSTTGLDRKAAEAFRKMIARTDGELKRLEGLLDFSLHSRDEDQVQEDKVLLSFLEASGCTHHAALPLSTPVGQGLLILLFVSPPPWSRVFGQALAGAVTLWLENIRLEKTAEYHSHDYQRIFERSPDMIYLSSRDGRWQDVNEAGVRILGFDSREELLAVPDIAEAAYYNPEDRIPFQQAIETHGFVKDYEVTFKRKDGTPVEVSITAQVRTRDGQVQGYEGIIKDITERKQAEALVARERSLLGKILELMPVAIFVVDREHRVVQWNLACEQLTGVEREDILGTPDVWRVFKRPKGVSLADVVLDDDREKMFQIYGAGRLRPSPLARGAWEAEAHFDELGGRPKDLLFTAAALRDDQGQVTGAVEAILDTTDIKQLECQLAESEQLYRTMVESSLEGIALHDGEKFVFANRHFLNMFGLGDTGQAQGDFLELLDPASQRRYLKWLQQGQEGENGGVFEGHGVRGADLFDLELVAAPTSWRGRHAYLYTVRDVTYRKTMEERLVSQERLAATGKLAFDIAHEVNNPLGGIITYAYLLHEDVPEESPEWETVGKIIKLANRCKIIIRGLLDFARKDTPERELVDLNSVVREMLSLIEGHVIMRKVKVDLDLDQLPPFYGHRSKLEQVFLNVVINAAEAMEGEGRLTIRTEADEEEQVVRLYFQDTGPGIPEDVVGRLFEPFFTTKGRGRGTGLGLAISHGIVQQHYGKIEVETKMGEGTRFCIVLPFRHPGANPATGK